MSHQQNVKMANASLIGGLNHLQVVIKAFVRNPPRDEESHKKWSAQVVEAIKMKVVVGPFAKYVSSCGNAGVTGGCIIETSHLISHVWDEISPAMVQLDCYSCSYFDEEVIVEKLKEFDLVSFELMLIDRNEGFKVLRHLERTVQ